MRFPRVLIAVLIPTLFAAPMAGARGDVTLATLGHIHDVAVGPANATYVAGHDGIYAVRGNEALRIAEGHFSTLVWDGDQLLASGPEGRLTSINPATGREAQPNRPTGSAFTLLAAGPGHVLYGVSDGIYVRKSMTSGWERLGDLPAQAIDLAVSARNSRRLFLATGKGLFVSEDGGGNWHSAMPNHGMSTAVTTQGGQVYAFERGVGLLRAEEGELRWTMISNSFGPELPIHFAVADDGHMFAVTNYGKIFTSQDAGRDWRRLDRPKNRPSAATTRGRAIYQANCQTCHGVNGVGEAPQFMRASSQALAPALDETMHAWHHTDANLLEVIENGTGGRMPAWAGTLQDDDVRDVIAYLKSLWGEHELECQGPAHMRPECRR